MSELVNNNALVNSRRQWMLTTVSAMALGASLAAPALAQDASTVINTTGFPPVSTATGLTTFDDDQLNTSVSISSIANADLLVGANIPNKSLVTISTNSIAAAAGGNLFTNTSAGPVLPLSTSLGGIAVINSQTNLTSTITSTVGSSGTKFSADLVGVPVGTVLVDGNTLSATTNLNAGSTNIAGQVPLAYTSATAQSTIVDTSTTTPVKSQGAIVSTSVQQNLGSGQQNGSSAQVLNNKLDVTITGTLNTNETVGGTTSISSNSIGATFNGNNVQHLVSVQGGTDPTFNGAIAVTTVQLNQDGGIQPDPVSALAADNHIVATIVNNGGVETLGGTLNVNNNSISSAATGNLASGPNGAGNVIQVADGLNYVGTGSVPAGGTASTVAFTGGGNVQVTQTSDLSVVNVQGNAAAPLNALTTGNSITADVDNVNKGTISVANNSVSSAATGNNAFNAIQAGGSSTNSFDGTAGITSLQNNSNSPISATTSATTIHANVDTPGSNDLVNGTVRVDGNSVTATAYGSSVGNALNVSASSVTSNVTNLLGGILPGSVSGDRNTEVGSANAGLVIQNQQNNEASSPVTALVTGTIIELEADVDGALTGSTLSMNGNTIQAMGAGNVAGSAINVSATSLNGSAALLNAQTSRSGVSATVADSQIVTDPGYDLPVQTSNITQDGNKVKAIAGGNVSENSVKVTAGSITLAEIAPANSAQVSVDTGATHPLSPLGSPASASANFVAANNQEVAGSITASVDGTANPILQVYAQGDGAGFDHSFITQNNNQIVAAARGNQGTTNIALSASVDITVPGEQAPMPIASAQNVQAMQANTSVSATVTGYPSTISGPVMAGSALVSYSDGDTSFSSIAAQGNQILALANGNEGTTGVSVTNTGTIANPQAVGSATLTQTLFTTPTVVTSNPMLSVQNVQAAARSTVSATVSGAGIDPTVDGSLSNGSLTIGGWDPIAEKTLGNSIGAQAAANTATNSLAIQATTIQTTGGVQSHQSSDAGVTAAVNGTLQPQLPDNTDTYLGPAYSSNLGIAVAGTVDVSALTIQANRTTANATGNDVTNTLTATANAITGLIGSSGSSLGYIANATTVQTTATLGLQNVQNVTTGVAATQTGTGAVIAVADTITKGNLSIGGVDPLTGTNLGNVFSSTAIGNNAVNTAGVLATNLQASSTLQNIQNSTASVTATTGAAGVAAQPGTPGTAADTFNYNFSLPNTGEYFFAGSNPVAVYDSFGGIQATSTVSLNGQGLTTTEVNYLLGNGWAWLNNVVDYTNGTLVYNNPTMLSNAPPSFPLTPTIIFVSNSVDTTGSLTATVPASPPTPGTAGILASPALVIFAGGNIIDSHLGVDNNSVSAVAVSNQAVNTSVVGGTATVDGTTASTQPLSGQAIAGSFFIGPVTMLAAGDHTLLNAQFASGPANATAFSYHGIIALNPAAAITGSALSVSDNTQKAAAEGNFAANTLVLTGGDIGFNAPVFTALSSTQQAGFEQGAVANSASVMAIEGPGYITRSSLDLNRNSNTSLTIVNDVSNRLAVSATNLTGGVGSPDPAAPVAVAGVANAPPPVGVSASAVSPLFFGPYSSLAAAAADHALASSQSVFFPGIVSSTATTVVRNNDAIIVGATDITGNLTNSTASMSNNETQALTVGNRATKNSLEISASAGNSASGALSNSQEALGDAEFRAVANSTVSYTGGVGLGAGNVTNSSLLLNGNLSRADAVANTAVNSLTSIAGASQAGTNGLLSVQTSFIGGEGAAVSAVANGSVSVGLGNDVASANPSSVSASTVSLSGNAVAAFATVNDATNSLVSRGTNVIGDMAVDATAGTSGPFGGAIATNALANVQFADHSGVQAVANNTVSANVGTAALASGAISNSTVVMDGNITVAQAAGNRAANTLTVDAGANLSATAGLANLQINDGPIGAAANSVIGLNGGIATQTPTALSASTVSISDNVTQAFATGNDATNAVNFFAGAGYNVAAIVNQAVAGTNSASGSVALFNSQQNGGSVVATANGTNYQVALNALNTAVQNSTINISGNVLKSQAVGNLASNTITTTALNTGAPTVALASNQVNSGNITAVTSANFGVNIAGLTSSSTLRQVGNSLSATAIGNAVTNVITAR